MQSIEISSSALFCRAPQLSCSMGATPYDVTFDTTIDLPTGGDDGALNLQ